MTEKPIIFSAPMVRAILDGRKTMTRRVVKPQPEYRENVSVPGHFSTWAGGGWNLESKIGKTGFESTCPYGSPGDRLIVKEGICAKFVGHDAYISYAADDELVKDKGAVIPWGYRRKSLSGRFMRPAYSRLTLEIVSVQVERVQEISEGDAIKEGWKPLADGNPGNGGPFDWFRSLWESIHGPGSWERNDWCWVIEFRRIA